MKPSRKIWAATLAWAALVIASAKGDATGLLPAAWIIAMAPLALAVLVAIERRERTHIAALEAEALAWEQPAAESSKSGDAGDGRVLVNQLRPAWAGLELTPN